MPLSYGVARAADDPPSFAFTRTQVNAGGEHPEICLIFNGALDASRTDGLAANVTLTPAMHFVPRVEDNHFCLGGLSYNTAYHIAVAPGFRSAAQEMLAGPLTLSAHFGDRPAMVALSGDGYVLPQEVSGNIVVQTVNMPVVRVHVYHLSQSLAQVAGMGGGPDINMAQTTMDRGTFQFLLSNRLTEVWQGTLETGGQKNRSRSTGFPLGTITHGQQDGLYLVTAENPATSRPSGPAAEGDEDPADSAPPLAVHWVSLSNIGLSVARGSDGLSVTARSYATALPLPGVKVTLVSAGQDALGTTVTDAQGQARFDAGLLRGRHGAEAEQLRASTANDFTMVRLNRPWFDFSDLWPQGARAYSRHTVLLETDRGIYRPGETVQLVALLRDRFGMAVANQPLTFVLHRPDNVEDRRFMRAGSADGGFVLPLPLGRSAQPGPWRLDAFTDPTLPPVGKIQFQVDDFRPQTISMTMAATPQVYQPGNPVALHLSTRYLYGAPGAGLHGEGSYAVRVMPTPVPAYAGWAFGLENESVPDIADRLDIPDADARGNSTVSFTPTLPAGGTRPLEIRIDAGFSDPSGREVSQQLSVPVRRVHELIGLRARPPASSDGTVAVPVDVVTIDPDDHPVATKGLHWTLSRLNRIFDWTGNEQGGWSYTVHTVDVPVGAGDTQTDGNGLAHLTQNLDWGEYRLTLGNPATGAASSTTIAVGWSAQDDSDTPDRLAVTARNDEIPPNGTTQVHIAGGFAGRAQLMIATDHILSTRVLDVPAQGLDVPVTADAQWGQGAYALVTLYRPLSAPHRPHDPVRAVGLAWIGVDNHTHHLSIALHAPDKALPRQRLSIPVNVNGATAGRPIRLTLAAVDQGILNLTSFQQPDLFRIMFGPQGLGVDITDTYNRLLLGNAPVGRIREGGDAFSAQGSALSVTTARTVALFSGEVTPDARGHGTVTLDVPDFEGQLHLMATAWSVDGIGTATADTLIRDPVFPDMTLPRFLAPGDSAQSLLSIVNNDGPDQAYHLNLTATGPLHFGRDASINATLAPGARYDTPVTLVADHAGIVHFHAVLSAPGTSAPLAVRDWSMEIRPGHLPYTQSQSAAFAPGAKVTLGPEVLAGLAKGDVKVTAGFSAAEGLDTIGLLQALQTSVWGSSEMLAAQARALLYLDNPALLGMGETRASVHDRVQSAIDAMLAREDGSGVIGQWRLYDGESLPDMQDYLADFLTRARAAGYNVPDTAYNLLMDQIETRQLQAGGEDDASDRNSRAYAAYVFARAGRLRPDAIQALATDLNTARQNGRTYLLWAGAAAEQAQAMPLAIGHVAAALALDDMPEQAAHLFDQAESALGAARTGRPGLLDIDYWRYVRDLSGLAALAAEAHDTNRAAALIRRFQSLQLGASELDGTEQTALLEAAAALDQDEPGRRIRMGTASSADPLHLPAAFPLGEQALAQGISMENTGDKPLYRTLTVHGTPVGAVRPLTNGMVLTASAVSLSGEPVDVTHLNQNDRFIMRFDGEVSDNDMHQIGLVDLLPAGWEIESVITPGNDAYKFLGHLDLPRSVQARDDRFVAVMRVNDPDADLSAEDDDGGDGLKQSVNPHEFHAAYIVRAVTPGTFIRPEILAEDLNRPMMLARTASSTTTVMAR
ncbi:alpha-2-macroglobulin [Komagataeibacter sp. FNDCR2]|uniref:alpha-2-macroglobulin family protein n=1 Tax=Komagataeibacter sp. FNDCR2 TaxID=2878682 RepID=UPI001E5FCC86|nr:MG2 domain-containing protein [Komagataeibacter sp. FNDCR2]MCE2576166.1 hypothetical protein [Komagataeibacter sp. FNDCR2]